MRRIIVACGTAIATSTHVASKIQRALAARTLDVPIVQCRVSEVEGVALPGDVVVATAQVPGSVQAQVFNGVPLLTGIGEKELLDQIVAAVQGSGKGE